MSYEIVYMDPLNPFKEEQVDNFAMRGESHNHLFHVDGYRLVSVID